MCVENLVWVLLDYQISLNNNNTADDVAYLRNAGKLRKSGGSCTATVTFVLLNSGTTVVQQGLLNFDFGGTIEGTFNAAAGTTVRFFGGSFDYAIPPVLNGPGTYQFTSGNLALINNVIPNLQMIGGTVSLGVNFQGGTITNLAAPALSGNYTVSGTLNCSGGVAGSLTVANGGLVNWTGGNVSSNFLVLGGGTVNWSGGTVLSNLSVLGGATLNWSGGSLGVYGGPANSSLFVASNGVMNLSGSDLKWLIGGLTNAGTVTWSGSGYINVYNPGRVENLPGAVWEIQNDQRIVNNSASVSYFQNSGTLLKSGGTGTTSVEIPLTNSGLVSVQLGLLNFFSGGTIEGTFNAAGGTIVRFSGGSFDYAIPPVLNGPGTYQPRCYRRSEEHTSERTSLTHT